MSSILEFIGETLEHSSAELVKRFGATKSIQTKKDLSIVTDADLASEKIILDRISGRCDHK
jgi:fructose-1,6-bisphosphatase/inositol monophosphatase family enzyme